MENDFRILFQDDSETLEDSLFLDPDRVEELNYRIESAVHDFQGPLRKDEKRNSSTLIKQLLSLAKNSQELAYVGIQTGNILSQMRNNSRAKNILEMLMNGRPPLD